MSVATASMESRPAERRTLPLAAQASLLAGPFLSMLDANIVNVALPDITRRLHTALDTAQWVLSGYLLALAAGLAASAYLASASVHAACTWRAWWVSRSPPCSVPWRRASVS